MKQTIKTIKKQTFVTKPWSNGDDGQAEAEPQNRFTLWAPSAALLILNSVNCISNWQILRCVRSEADMRQAEA